MTGMARAQRGLSMIAFLFVAAVIVVVAAIGFRVVPAYIEYFTVRSAVEKSLRDSPELTAASIKKSFDKYIAADYNDSVTSADLNVAREGNAYVATVAWQRELHLVGNVSLLLDFNVSAQR